MELEPTSDRVHEASVRLAGRVWRTPVVRSEAIDGLAGTAVWLKCENFQHVGAFKARGALNAVLQLDPDVARRGVAAHSSGNHAAALAFAGRSRGIPVTVVMPSDAPAVKRRTVERLGATIVPCEPTLAARTETLAGIVGETGVVEIHPYDDPRVIAGAGTAALELLDERPELDLIVAPVGGGGLLSGSALATGVHSVRQRARDPVRVWGGEPAEVADAARSVAVGERQPTTGGTSVADGLLTALSERTFGIIRQHVESIVVVSEAEIIEAMRLLFEQAKLVAEPSAAVGLAAVLRRTGELPANVGVIVSGGNVDVSSLPF